MSSIVYGFRAFIGCKMVPSLAMLIQAKWLDDGLILFNKLIDLSIGSVCKQVNKENVQTY